MILPGLKELARNDFLDKRAEAVLRGFGFGDNGFDGVAVGEVDAGGADDEHAATRWLTPRFLLEHSTACACPMRKDRVNLRRAGWCILTVVFL